MKFQPKTEKDKCCIDSKISSDYSKIANLVQHLVAHTKYISCGHPQHQCPGTDQQSKCRTKVNHMLPQLHGFSACSPAENLAASASADVVQMQKTYGT